MPEPSRNKVCDGCGKAKPLRYFIKIGDPPKEERGYCSLGCARLHFPGYTGK
jgi:hypothetical protein